VGQAVGQAAAILRKAAERRRGGFGGRFGPTGRSGATAGFNSNDGRGGLGRGAPSPGFGRGAGIGPASATGHGGFGRGGVGFGGRTSAPPPGPYGGRAPYRPG
jgi:hypothetical protein